MGELSASKVESQGTTQNNQYQANLEIHFAFTFWGPSFLQVES